MNNSNLTLMQQGTKGGAPKSSPNIGLVCSNIDGVLQITVDAFQGHGDTYRRRESCEITITNDGTEIFKGTAGQLTAILCAHNG